MILKSSLKVRQETQLLKLFPSPTENLEIKFQAKLDFWQRPNSEFLNEIGHFLALTGIMFKVIVENLPPKEMQIKEKYRRR